MRERHRDEPKVDWVTTGTTTKIHPGSPTAGWTVGSGENDITRAGLPNADPDGYDEERSDLEGIDVGGADLAPEHEEA